MEQKQILELPREILIVFLEKSHFFRVLLNFNLLYSNFYKLIKAFFRIILTIIYKMNPFFYQNYLYRHPYPFSWFPPGVDQAHDFYRFYAPSTHSLQHHYSLNKQFMKRDSQTKPQIIKVEQSDSNVPAKVHQTEEKNKKNTKKSGKNIAEIKDPEVVEKFKNGSNIKAKYYDPSRAPTITTDEYNQITNLDKQNCYFHKIKQITLPFLNQLNFPQQHDFPFIVFKHRRIKKKYRVYLKHKNAIENFNRENSDSPSQSQSIDQSIQAKNQPYQHCSCDQIVKLSPQIQNKKINEFRYTNKNQQFKHKQKEYSTIDQKLSNFKPN